MVEFREGMMAKATTTEASSARPAKAKMAKTNGGSDRAAFARRPETSAR